MTSVLIIPIELIPAETIDAVRQASTDALTPLAAAAYEAHRGQGHGAAHKAATDAYTAHMEAVVITALVAAVGSISPYMDGYTAARNYVAAL